MLDNSITGHSQFATFTTLTRRIDWNGRVNAIEIGGFVRKQVHSDASYQAEIDALFTVGNLLRKSVFHAFTYDELVFESWRRVMGERPFDALADCAVLHCEAPIERSRFFQTSEFAEYVLKGGKKDRKSGRSISMSQIRFVEWLLSLCDDAILGIIANRGTFQISNFEIESFRNINWFRAMCRIAQSSENYPDMLHMWAAQRNGMDVFLTLERRLPNVVDHFPKDQACVPSYPTMVMHPRQLLQMLGVSEFESVPIEAGRFYPLVGRPFPLNDEDSAPPGCTLIG